MDTTEDGADTHHQISSTSNSVTPNNIPNATNSTSTTRMLTEEDPEEGSPQPTEDSASRTSGKLNIQVCGCFHISLNMDCSTTFVIQSQENKADVSTSSPMVSGNLDGPDGELITPKRESTLNLSSSSPTLPNLTVQTDDASLSEARGRNIDVNPSSADAKPSPTRLDIPAADAVRRIQAEAGVHARFRETSPASGFSNGSVETSISGVSTPASIAESVDWPGGRTPEATIFPLGEDEATTPQQVDGELPAANTEVEAKAEPALHFEAEDDAPTTTTSMVPPPVDQVSDEQAYIIGATQPAEILSPEPDRTHEQQVHSTPSEEVVTSFDLARQVQADEKKV